ncbi:hypothetical protein [Streptomyces sp. NPDC050738]|uniref:hypothetical protein n=1 Tax=Streptomyces sp. NPDC050738 TaxID=3154744 RepID=UPI0034460C30
MPNFAFPDDLSAAQLDLHKAQAEHQAFALTLPLGAEPLDEVDDKSHWYRRNHPRPASPGYTPEQATELARLRALVLELATKVVTHPYWETVEAGSRVDARTALKHVHDQADDQAEAA